jgi:hypothetical protein
MNSIARKPPILKHTASVCTRVATDKQPEMVRTQKRSPRRTRYAFLGTAASCSASKCSGGFESSRFNSNFGVS